MDNLDNEIPIQAFLNYSNQWVITISEDYVRSSTALSMYMQGVDQESVDEVFYLNEIVDAVIPEIRDKTESDYFAKTIIATAAKKLFITRLIEEGFTEETANYEYQNFNEKRNTLILKRVAKERSESGNLQESLAAARNAQGQNTYSDEFILRLQQLGKTVLHDKGRHQNSPNMSVITDILTNEFPQYNLNISKIKNLFHLLKTNLEG